ncbi:MAG: hypothetical protein VX589_11980 [Myxococcota bacterium]|nr:hypothetical protein [Myxococcota bacterium]
MNPDYLRAKRQLCEATGNRNRFALTGGHGYIVFSTQSADSPVTVQATAGRRLPPGVRLSPADAGCLGDRGLRQQRASQDFRSQFDRGDDDAWTKWLTAAPALLTTVYGATEAEIEVRTCFEKIVDLDNQSLVEAMNHLAKVRTWSARTGLYMSLVRAQLVCALADEATASTDHAPLYEAGQIGDFPSFALFTDYAALDNFKPIGLRAKVVKGMDIFPRILANRVGSVLINPHGQPRGELYNNEIGIIVDGIKRLKGIH